MPKENSKVAAKQKAAAPQTQFSAAAYDEVPYTSHAFPQTSPLIMQAVSKLFGLTVPDPDKARILEIGCASGSNIMSIASRYPKSTCVGLDYSKKQIDSGIDEVKAIGLTNIELKHMSVADVTKELGTFDYIICHGVLSWVPVDIQEKILQVCRDNLTPDGVAFISYNTLPGWNSVRSVRDMMLYHTSHFDDPKVKVQQARLILKFMHDSTKDKQGAFSSVVKNELELLEGQPDYYILHEHLEENNHAFYFHEFMTLAGRHNMQYLGDTSLETMFSGNLPAATAQVLSTSNDIVRTEQFMDFISDRRFRNTLICHKDRILNRNVSPSIIADGWITSRFGWPDNFAGHDIKKGDHLDFQAAGGLKLSSNDPFTLALLQVFLRHHQKPVRVAEIVKEIEVRITEAGLAEQGDISKTLEERIYGLLVRYLFVGGLVFQSSKPPFVTTVSEKPKASDVARYQAVQKEWVPNQRQETIALLPLDRVLIRHLDGKNGMEEWISLILPHFESKELIANDNNVPIEDMEKVRERLHVEIPAALQRLAFHALLIK